MSKSWKQVDPKSPESLRLFVSDWVDRLIKAGYFTIKDDIKAKVIQKQVNNEMFSELEFLLSSTLENNEVDAVG